jgi:hypothetical protein
MLCGHQVPYSETWPTSGMTQGGRLYPLPPPEHPTGASASSSSRGLLPTPNATDSQGGPRAVPERRTSSGLDHGPRLRDVAPALPLLKTPTAQLAVNGGSQHPDKRREGGHGPTLADQVECELLPTPSVADVTGGHRYRSGDRRGELLLPGVAEMLTSHGEPTNSLSGGGNESSAAQLHGQLSLDEQGND